MSLNVNRVDVDEEALVCVILSKLPKSYNLYHMRTASIEYNLYVATLVTVRIGHHGRLQHHRHGKTTNYKYLDGCKWGRQCIDVCTCTRIVSIYARMTGSESVRQRTVCIVRLQIILSARSQNIAQNVGAGECTGARGVLRVPMDVGLIISIPVCGHVHTLLISHNVDYCKITR